MRNSPIEVHRDSQYVILRSFSNLPQLIEVDEDSMTQQIDEIDKLKDQYGRDCLMYLLKAKMLD